jgi:polyphenol oxidase
MTSTLAMTTTSTFRRSSSNNVRWGTTTRAEGSFALPDLASDLAPDPSADLTAGPAVDIDTGCNRDAVARLQSQWDDLTGSSSTWLRQIHGTDVVTVTGPHHGVGLTADAAVTDRPGVALGVITADCAPIVLIGERAVGVVHAGWRGLLGGVIGRTVEAMADLGEGPDRVRAHLAPCIRSCCYEFGASDLALIEQAFGPTVVGRTRGGSRALDMEAGVREALRRVGIVELSVTPRCTACDDRYFSWRRGADRGRQATWVALDGAGPT